MSRSGIQQPGKGRQMVLLRVGLSALLLLLSETDVVSTGKLNAATYCGRYLAWTSSRETRFIQSGTDSRWTFIEPFIMAVLTRC